MVPPLPHVPRRVEHDTPNMRCLVPCEFQGNMILVFSLCVFHAILRTTLLLKNYSVSLECKLNSTLYFIRPQAGRDPHGAWLGHGH